MTVREMTSKVLTDGNGDFLQRAIKTVLEQVMPSRSIDYSEQDVTSALKPVRPT